MERLTTQIEKIRIREDNIRELKNTISIEELQQHYIEIFDKLQAYEVEEENDMLLHLPCKIGDTMYKVCTVNDDIQISGRWDGRIVKTNCDRCGYCGCGCHDIGLRNMNCNNAVNVIVPKKITSVQMALDIEPYIGKIWFYGEWDAKCYIESYERKVKI